MSFLVLFSVIVQSANVSVILFIKGF